MINYQTQPDGPALWVPTLEDVEDLRTGHFAPDCFGRIAKVDRIIYRGTDVNGRAYVGYYTEMGANSTISNSMKENELIRTVAAISRHTSAELDAIERQILAGRSKPAAA